MSGDTTREVKEVRNLPPDAGNKTTHIAILENDVQYIKRDLSEIKSAIAILDKTIRNGFSKELSAVKEGQASMRTQINTNRALLLIVLAGVLGGTVKLWFF